MSIVGGGRSYRKVNPQLAQCVESVRLVYQGLNRAPNEWWKTNNLVITDAPAPPLDDGARMPSSYNDGFGDDSESETENNLGFEQ